MAVWDTLKSSVTTGFNNTIATTSNTSGLTQLLDNISSLSSGSSDTSVSGGFVGNTVNIGLANKEYTDAVSIAKSKNPGLFNQSTWKMLSGNTGKYVKEANEDSVSIRFKMPDWSYADMINERALWQKGIYSPAGEPGWFYFKIFFDFSTQYGLLGGLLNNSDPTSGTNSAARYLNMLSFDELNTQDRLFALKRFASILSYINCQAPWFFKSVKNVNQADMPLIKDFGKEKSFEIEFNTDAIDMRLTTLFDLYKYVCYDNVFNREVLPENLRKFDVSIVVFQTPLKYFHTGMNSKSSGTFRYKTLNSNILGYENLMSFKLYTFVNCEINLESLQNIYPSDFSNESPFQLGKNTIKINYDRVYTHTMNEFFGIMWGDDGFYYDRYGGTSSKVSENKIQAARYTAMQNMLDKVTESVDSSNPTKFKELTDLSEAICNFNIGAAGLTGFGNIYTAVDDNNNTVDPTVIDKKTHSDLYKSSTASTRNPQSEDYNDYYKTKLDKLKNPSKYLSNNEHLNHLYGNDIDSELRVGLGSIYHNNVNGDGTMYGFDYGVGGSADSRKISQYLTDKLNALHDGAQKNPNSERNYDTSSKASGLGSLYETATGIKGYNLTRYRTSFGRINSVYMKDKLLTLKKGIYADDTIYSDNDYIRTYTDDYGNIYTEMTPSQRIADLNGQPMRSGLGKNRVNSGYLNYKLNYYKTSKSIGRIYDESQFVTNAKSKSEEIKHGNLADLNQNNGIVDKTNPTSNYKKSKLNKLRKGTTDNYDYGDGITEITKPDSAYAEAKIEALYIGSVTGSKGITAKTNPSSKYTATKLKKLANNKLDVYTDAENGVTDFTLPDSEYYQNKLLQLYINKLNKDISGDDPGITQYTNTSNSIYIEKLKNVKQGELNSSDEYEPGFTEKTSTSGIYFNKKIENLASTGLDSTISGNNAGVTKYTDPTGTFATEKFKDIHSSELSNSTFNEEEFNKKIKKNNLDDEQGITQYTNPVTEYAQNKIADLKDSTGGKDTSGVQQYTDVDLKYSKEKIANINDGVIDTGILGDDTGILEYTNPTGEYAQQKLENLKGSYNKNNYGAGITELTDPTSNYAMEKLETLKTNSEIER